MSEKEPCPNCGSMAHDSVCCHACGWKPGQSISSPSDAVREVAREMRRLAQSLHQSGRAAACEMLTCMADRLESAAETQPSGEIEMTGPGDTPLEEYRARAAMAEWVRMPAVDFLRVTQPSEDAEALAEAITGAMMLCEELTACETQTALVSTLEWIRSRVRRLGKREAPAEKVLGPQTVQVVNEQGEILSGDVQVTIYNEELTNTPGLTVKEK